AVAASAVTEAARVIDSPTLIVAVGGVTVMLCTPVGWPATVTLSPQAADSVPNARTPATSSVRENLCILPPEEWCGWNCGLLLNCCATVVLGWNCWSFSPGPLRRQDTLREYFSR